MIEIGLYNKVGEFGENKDIAREIRLKEIEPSLEKGEVVILNFKNVELVTQSFIHALISEVIRTNGPEILDRLQFKTCNQNVKIIISTVVEYMQDKTIQKEIKE